MIDLRAHHSTLVAAVEGRLWDLGDERRGIEFTSEKIQP
jgi:hypothetical protein